MANNNVQNVRFLRNGVLFTSREQATSALTNFTLTSEMDGSSILARYQEGTDPIKTLVGYVYYKDANNNSITIFDIDDAGTDVDEKIDELRSEINAKLGEGITSANTATAQLAALSGNSSTSTSAETSVEGAKRYADAKILDLDYTGVTTGDGVYVTNVTQADGKVSATTADMPTVAVKTEDGKPIIAVSQTKGTIAASAGTIDAQYVNIADSGEKFTATTVEGALAEIATEIDAMDLAVVSGDGEVITAVSEEDGKVSASKTAIKDVKLTGYVKNTTATGAISATDDIEDALSKLENTIGSNAITNADGSITVTPANGSTDVKVNIKSGEKVIKLDGNGGGIYTDIKLSAVTPSSTTVKEEYSLVATDGTVLGSNIKIYKDSSLVSISYITSGEHAQNLEYVYIDASGNTHTTYVDMSELVLEAEFASGLTIENHVARGVVDSTSEKNESDVAFLTVGADGFKINGIKDAIDTKINKLDADLSGNSTHVTVGVAEADGKITAVTVSESNVANADDLTTLSGKSVTAVEMTGGTAAIAANSADGTKKITINTDGSQVKLTGYAKGSASGAVETTDSVNAAIGKLENRIDGKVDALDATVSSETTSKHVKVVIVQENGVLTGVTLTDSDIASATALTAEIAARKAVDGQDGQTYAKNTSSPYISGATSLNDADVKLDAALKSLSDATVNEVQVNGVALAETSNAVNVQISAAAGTGAASTPITVDTDSSTGAVTLKLEGLDCGTY